MVSEKTLPEAQCTFRPGCSTVDMVFTVRQVQEKCIEQVVNFYIVFIDLMKAFDTKQGSTVDHPHKTWLSQEVHPPYLPVP